MKRREFLHHLAGLGCELLLEGSRHSVYFNPKALRTSTVPRHREVDDFLVRKICRDLQIPPPKCYPPWACTKPKVTLGPRSISGGWLGIRVVSEVSINGTMPPGLMIFKAPNILTTDR